MALNKGSPYIRAKQFMKKEELGLNSDQQGHQLENRDTPLSSTLAPCEADMSRIYRTHLQ